MKVNEIYERTVIKANRNKGTQNVSIDKYRWVLSYNENRIKRIEYLLDKKNDDDVREIQEAVKNNTELIKVQTLSDRVLFELPKDYLDLSSAYAYVSQKDCKNQKIYLWELKDQNYGEIFPDSFNEPSLEYEESFFTIQGGNLVIFKKDDLKIDKVFITYYFYPPLVDIEGYIKSDNITNSSNQEEIMSDRFINKVVSMVVADFARNNQDVQAKNLNQDRIVTNF
jgi:hypothetical protein